MQQHKQQNSIMIMYSVIYIPNIQTSYQFWDRKYRFRHNMMSTSYVSWTHGLTEYSLAWQYNYRPIGQAMHLLVYKNK